MNVMDMTDAEIYELALEILFDKLGHAGLIQFLRHCKPCTGNYTVERQKRISDDTTDERDLKAIIEPETESTYDRQMRARMPNG